MRWVMIMHSCGHEREYPRPVSAYTRERHKRIAREVCADCETATRPQPTEAERKAVQKQSDVLNSMTRRILR